MSSRALLKAIGDIDEKYLLEAEFEKYEVGKNISFKKVAVILLIILLIASSVTFASVKIIEKISREARITPVFTSNLSTIDESTIWIGTFNLVWNDIMDNIVKGKIEFEDGPSNLADELNKRNFTKDELSENSYLTIFGPGTNEFREEIKEKIKEKFNEESDVLDDLNLPEYEPSDPGDIIYALLKKEFTFLKEFEILESSTFNGSENKVKYFGLNHDGFAVAGENIEVLFYNSKDDFAVKLKTKEKEEVILYMGDYSEKSFEENYNILKEKEAAFVGDKNYNEEDILRVPFISLKEKINYDELCGRFIKGTNKYIKQAIQSVDFQLNNVGGSVKSEAVVYLEYRSFINPKGREFIFDTPFLLYLKEEGKNKPYLALKVENTDILVDDSEFDLNEMLKEKYNLNF